MLADFYNPDLLRWELHRVWVVEMLVKPGKRNVDKRRLVYFDEDTWQALMTDIYDASGSLWKYQCAVPAILADIPAMVLESEINYDFHLANYGVESLQEPATQPQYTPIAQLPPSFFSPGQLAALAGGE
jgi:hypothetical protein